MDVVEARPDRAEENAAVAAARTGDEAAFGRLMEGYRRELQVHCYRMLGSFDESEDLVQETFLRAWRARGTFEGRSTFRAWLYRIATNACLDTLARRPRRPNPRPVLAAAPGSDEEQPAEIPWLQPYPDRLLDQVAPRAAEPDAVIVARETIELAFLAAIQHLPPRQRAVLILRDVLGWPAGETAALLGMSVAAVKSALQRARPTLQARLSRHRLDWAPATDPNAEERAVLERYMEAHERVDLPALAALLREDARLTMPPHPFLAEGRDAITAVMGDVLDPASPGYQGHLRFLPTRANRQPAAANYIRRSGDSTYRALAIDVLRIEDGKVVEIIGFPPHLFPAFGLPPTL